MLSVTLPYAGLLGLWLVVLSVRVILSRRSEQVSLGAGDSKILERRIRAHGNFTEYVPITLLLIGFLELSGTPAWWIHILCLLLLVGRVLHGYALSFTSHSPLRVPGMALTLSALIGAGISAVLTALIP